MSAGAQGGVRSDAGVHGFDLHGCEVFEDFLPISALTSLIHKPVKVLDLDDAEMVPILQFPQSWLLRSFLTDGEAPAHHFGNEIWSLFRPSRSRRAGRDFIYIIRVPMSQKVAREFHEFSKKASEATPLPPFSEADASASEDVAIRQLQWLQPAPRFPPSGPPSGPPSNVAECESDVSTATSSDRPSPLMAAGLPGTRYVPDRLLWMAAVSNVKSVLSQPVLGRRLLDQFAFLSTWRMGVLTLLSRLEEVGCLAVAIVPKFPTNQLESISNPAVSSLVWRSLFPQDVKVRMTMPAIVVPDLSAAYPFIRDAVSDRRVTTSVITPIPLSKGDHICREIQPDGPLSLVKHHGLYVGNGRIIHFGGNEGGSAGLLFGSSKARVCSTTIVRFVAHGSRLMVVEYSPSRCNPVGVTLAQAEAALVEGTYPEYSLLSNNCEHFCTWCKTGKPRSKQAETGWTFGLLGSGLLVGGVLAGMLLARNASSSAKKREDDFQD